MAGDPPWWNWPNNPGTYQPTAWGPLNDISIALHELVKEVRRLNEYVRATQDQRSDKPIPEELPTADQATWLDLPGDSSPHGDVTAACPLPAEPGADDQPGSGGSDRQGHQDYGT